MFKNKQHNALIFSFLAKYLNRYFGRSPSGRAMRCNANLPYGTASAFPLLSLTHKQKKTSRVIHKKHRQHTATILNCRIYCLRKYLKNTLILKLANIKSVEVHHLVPSGYEIVHELSLRICKAINFSNGSEF
jgi:hypothetical protein